MFFNQYSLQSSKLAAMGLLSDPIGMFGEFLLRFKWEREDVLLVPPPPRPLDELNWDDLMSRINFEGKHGRTWCLPETWESLTEVADVPTVLVGFEDGSARMDEWPTDEGKPADGHVPCNLWQVYVFACMFPETLHHHGLDALGTRCRDRGYPSISIVGEEPTLCVGYHSRIEVPWGAPAYMRCEKARSLMAASNKRGV